VTALASCPGTLVSGGEDAAVHVWLLSQAVDQLAAGDAAVAPIATVAEHTMPITAIHISQAGLLAGRGRLYTASRDHTCKQWQLRVAREGERLVGRAQLLATLLYPAAVSDIAIDSNETRAFAATAAGLFQTNLYAYAAGGAGSGLAALGGTGDSVLSEGHVRYPAAEARIAAVGLSLDGTLLVSATGEGVVRVWDTASRQCLRTISDKQLGSGVTQLAVRLAPPPLGGPRALAGAGLRRADGASGRAGPQKAASVSFAPLQRLARENGAGETTAFEAAVKVTLGGAREDMARFDAALSSSEPYGETARGAMHLLGGLRAADGSAKRQVASLWQQLERLQRHNARTRLLNDELYQGAVTEWLSRRR
ncbi:Pre-rRNA-processing protein ipi3, partial [Coemansia helicoidea]